MYLQRKRGIIFSSEGNDKPILFSDASNKPDASDGLCQYGYCTMWKGGPVGSISKKLPHVGLSAFHNEYMALRYAATSAMWIRQILPEIGCGHYVKDPTTIFGDNTAANSLTAKDFISSGNQHIYVPYHYIKELVRNKNIKVEYKQTKLNIADLFTKPVTSQVIEKLLPYLVGQNTSWKDEIPPDIVYKAKLAKVRRGWIDTIIKERSINLT